MTLFGGFSITGYGLGYSNTVLVRTIRVPSGSVSVVVHVLSISNSNHVCQ